VPSCYQRLALFWWQFLTASAAVATVWGNRASKRRIRLKSYKRLNCLLLKNKWSKYFCFRGKTGHENTATGGAALVSNTIGIDNTATGAEALAYMTAGDGNTATGRAALYSNAADANTATGWSSLFNNSTGSFNIALGYKAGALTTGDNNIDVGNLGGAGEANTIRIGNQVAGTDDVGFPHLPHTATHIAGIYGTTVAKSTAVFIDSNGHVGTKSSSERFKDEIKPTDNASEAILALKPVSFHYKKEIDPEGTPQFGLVAEQVAEVNPDLVVRDGNGEVYTVRYEAVNAMLLNELLKQHKRWRNNRRPSPKSNPMPRSRKRPSRRSSKRLNPSLQA
jgi:hypothetical protein